ncbi:hypothetical protein [Litoreibacter halocynthiae]|uniref:hypothetical protein n=1 Tax=Litoreibacter halocynthiae TaxID=1242689 RepID=UPI00248FD8B2|nr:hypothetical protein [Litoreibacter halocynthiae]
MKIVHVVTAAAVALSAPALVDGTGLPALDEFGIAYAGKGNGNGGGGGNGGGNAGKSSGKSSKAAGRTTGSQSKRSTAQRSPNPSAKGSGKLRTKFKSTLAKLGIAKQKTRTVKVVRKAPAKAAKSSQNVRKVTGSPAKKPIAAPREKNLHAQLKGLNSLNRNSNGFFNGKDPKLDPLRKFVASSAAYTGLESALQDAQAELTENQALLDEIATELGLSSDNLAEQRTEFEKLQDALLADEPELDDPDRSNWETQLAAVESGLDAVEKVEANADAVTSAEVDLEEAQGNVSDEALRDAIAASMNSTGSETVNPEELSDEVVEFVSDKLGVGEADGFIDVAVEEAESEDDIIEYLGEPADLSPVEHNGEIVEAL